MTHHYQPAAAVLGVNTTPSCALFASSAMRSSSFAVKSGRTELATETGATRKWAVDDIRDIDGLEPRLHRVDNLSLLQPRYRRELSLRYRLLLAAASLVPRFRDLHRLLRYEFPPLASKPAEGEG